MPAVKLGATGKKIRVPILERVFYYGVRPGEDAPWKETTRFKIVLHDDPSQEKVFTLSDADTVADFRIFKYGEMQEGKLYDGYLVEGDLQVQVFEEADLYRLSDPADDHDHLPLASCAAFESIEPATGDAAGGTAVTIKGTGLAAVTAAEIGGVALTDFAVNADGTEITGKTAAYDAGAADLVLRSPAGDVVASDGFTFGSPDAADPGAAANPADPAPSPAAQDPAASPAAAE